MIPEKGTDAPARKSKEIPPWPLMHSRGMRNGSPPHGGPPLPSSSTSRTRQFVPPRSRAKKRPFPARRRPTKEGIIRRELRSPARPRAISPWNASTMPRATETGTSKTSPRRARKRVLSLAVLFSTIPPFCLTRPAGSKGKGFPPSGHGKKVRARFTFSPLNPSLVRILIRCESTVTVLTPRISAISLVRFPSRIMPATWISRGVRFL